MPRERVAWDRDTTDLTTLGDVDHAHFVRELKRDVPDRTGRLANKTRGHRSGRDAINDAKPGLNYHLPYPMESVLTPKVTRVNRIDIGMRLVEDLRRIHLQDPRVLAFQSRSDLAQDGDCRGLRPTVLRTGFPRHPSPCAAQLAAGL